MMRTVLLPALGVLAVLSASNSAANEPLHPDRGSVSLTAECPMATVTVSWRWRQLRGASEFSSLEVLWNGVSTLDEREAAEVSRQLRLAKGERGFLETVRITCDGDRSSGSVSFYISEYYYEPRNVEIVSARLSAEGEVLLPLVVHRRRIGLVPVDEAFAPAAPQP
jgi:hypothetical protein